MKQVTLGEIVFGGGRPFVLIAGPCAIESAAHATALARRLVDLTRRLGVPFVFKASFDKANRTSAGSYRGPGLEEGLRTLASIKSAFGVPVLTDIHEAAQARPVAEVVDVLQIPAFLSRQTDLIVAAARTGRIVNIKKGQFLAPNDIKHAVGKATGAGNDRVIVTERGTSFGYHNLVVDMRSFPIMREQGYPVVFDVTHSLQLPGAGDGVSAGLAQYITPLASAGVAAGVDGLFLEVHDEPSRAKSDAQNALQIDLLEPLLTRLMALDAITKSADPDRRRYHHAPMPDRARARKVLETEAAAILGLIPRLDERFDRAVDLLRTCRGRVILTGMGKSGIICRKIAATLASTGTPAFFLHPAEAIHGDLGVIQSDDVVVALSYSGETAELLRLLETIRRLGARLIALTGSPDSTLAGAADVALDCGVTEEACPLNLVPTASTSAALAMGDALAMTLLDAKGFGQQDFATLHPGGKLGKKLMRVESLMHSGKQCPIVTTGTSMRDVIYEMSRKGLGMTCVVDGDSVLLGIITDGDLRRQMERAAAVLDMSAGDVMTRNPIVIQPMTLAAEALYVMEQRKITSIVVVDGTPPRLAGVVHLHDLWGTELV